VLTVLRDFFASFRHGHAYEMTAADSAAGAFDIPRRKPFDLFLLDVVIPATADRWLSIQIRFGLNSGEVVVRHRVRPAHGLLHCFLSTYDLRAITD